MSQKGHPKGLYLLYSTEMWERLNYYGMRSIFMLYLTNALLFDKEIASRIFSSFIGLVYLTPLIGGYISDHYWGNRRSIIIGGVLMAIGQFFMFLSGSNYDSPDMATTMMYVGLGIAIVGNGFFKPNISTMVGSLYEPGDHRVDSAFTIFYQGINVGALIGPFICGGFGEHYDQAGNVLAADFRWGFFAAFVGMSLSIVGFVWFKNRLLITPEGQAIGIPPHEVRARNNEKHEKAAMSSRLIVGGVLGFALVFALFSKFLETDLIGSIIFSSCIVLPIMILFDPSLTKIEIHRILVIYIIAFFVIFFWSAYEQAGSSLTFFTDEQTNRNLLGWEIPTSYFQSVNPVFIILISPVLVTLWSFLDKRGLEPIFSKKQALGLLLLALGYLFIAQGVKGLDPSQKVSMFWIIGLYFIHTVGELCLSPIGLSMVVKMAPVRLASLLMGVWFLSNSAANKLMGEFSALYPEEVKPEIVLEANPDHLKFLASQQIDTNSHHMNVKEMVAIQTGNFEYDKKTEKLTSIAIDSGTSAISIYHLKLIRKKIANFEHAIISKDGNYLAGYKREEHKLREGVKLTERVVIWNLKPEKPKILGFEIKNLYDFFMIFVYTAGAAAILLFALNPFLVKLMHGIR